MGLGGNKHELFLYGMIKKILYFFSHKLNELPVHIYNKWLEGMKQLNYSLFTQFKFPIGISFIYMKEILNSIKR